ncbi:HNH endonuclease family protein [Nocardiopsis chromatogenes]|uniref:HNH endonuclease family protein n=1 Tax=Nocardiopsis chromatogenes TaxID=280239 RepID=UPI000344E2F2|nr:HNH endonuclease family protein [Nocardiopsis chromatogenes]
MPRTPKRPSTRDRRKTGAYAIVVAVIAVAAVLLMVKEQGLDGALRTLTGGEATGTAVGGQGADAQEARSTLEAIPVAEPEPRGDYERDEFGSSWIDTDDNGCSTRNDILARDLADTEVREDCKVLAGVLDDPYTGDTVDFTAEDPQAVQIDHVVPLSLAWRMGASEWDRDTRVEFANDPGNLLASDGPANMSKGDSGPGEWQPYDGFQCDYSLAYIDVTDRYGLALAQDDHDALGDMLETCA